MVGVAYLRVQSCLDLQKRGQPGRNRLTPRPLAGGTSLISMSRYYCYHDHMNTVNGTVRPAGSRAEGSPAAGTASPRRGLRRGTVRAAARDPPPGAAVRREHAGWRGDPLEARLSYDDRWPALAPGRSPRPRAGLRRSLTQALSAAASSAGVQISPLASARPVRRTSLVQTRAWRSPRQPAPRAPCGLSSALCPLPALGARSRAGGSVAPAPRPGFAHAAGRLSAGREVRHCPCRWAPGDGTTLPGEEPHPYRAMTLLWPYHSLLP